MEGPLEDSEILHSGEDETWSDGLNLKTIPLCLRLLALYCFYFSYLCSCSSCLISLLAYHPSLSLSVNTHLKEAIEHLNSLFRGIKRGEVLGPSPGILFQFLF